MISKDLNVCVIPFEIIWDNIEQNIDNFKRVLNKVHPQTDLLILPETFLTGFPIDKSSEYIRETYNKYGSIIKELLLEQSRKNNMAICGSLIDCKNNEITNSAFFVEPTGDFYLSPKSHLFSMAGENKIFSPGNEKMIVRYRGWNIAMAICYDLRFPVWSRNVDNQYDLLVYVANWPDVRISAWQALLPARAIENEAYVCGANCKGTDNKGFSYCGSAHIFDYKGHSIGKETCAGTEEDFKMIYGKLSKEKLEKFREKFPAYLDADRFTIL